MTIVVDTSAVLGVILRERHWRALVQASRGAELVAPPSVPWEIGNALSAMFRQARISLDSAKQALEAFGGVPIRLIATDISRSVELAHNLGIYAYDAYIIECALRTTSPLLSLDRGLVEAAANAGVATVEISQ